jgi:broad specificity phosphatase PhoE
MSALKLSFPPFFSISQSKSLYIHAKPTCYANAVPMKTVYFIRHGVAIHNVPDPNTGQMPNLHDERYTDPSLIRQGEMQACELGAKLRQMGLILDGTPSGGSSDVMDTGCNTKQPIDLVVCSPLTRCLQTASHIFPNFSLICCHGDVREAYGMHYPDRRSPLSQLKAKFPHVTYHHPSLSTEDDVDWQPHIRETRDDVLRRIDNFLAWVTQQQHESFAVVTHGVWIECALLKYCPQVLEFGKKRVYNCECYYAHLVCDGDQLALKKVEQIA